MPAIGIDSGQVGTAGLEFQLLSCLLRAAKKTSDVSRTKFACVVANVVAQSRPVPLAACSSRSSMFLSTFSYPSSQARPFSLACAATWSLSSLTRFAAASSSALTSGKVMRGTPLVGCPDGPSGPSETPASHQPRLPVVSLADWHACHPGCRPRLSSSDQ